MRASCNEPNLIFLILASRIQLDDEGSQQWQEAHGRSHCCTRIRNHPPPHRPEPHSGALALHSLPNDIIKLNLDLQVLVDAIVNTGPREDSTRIGSQGTVRRQAVDVSPLRRVNQSISLLTIGVRTAQPIHKFNILILL